MSFQRLTGHCIGDFHGQPGTVSMPDQARGALKIFGDNSRHNFGWKHMGTTSRFDNHVNHATTSVKPRIALARWSTRRDGVGAAAVHLRDLTCDIRRDALDHLVIRRFHFTPDPRIINHLALTVIGN